MASGVIQHYFGTAMRCRIMYYFSPIHIFLCRIMYYFRPIHFFISSKSLKKYTTSEVRIIMNYITTFPCWLSLDRPKWFRNNMRYNMYWFQIERRNLPSGENHVTYFVPSVTVSSVKMRWTFCNSYPDSWACNIYKILILCCCPVIYGKQRF